MKDKNRKDFIMAFRSQPHGAHQSVIETLKRGPTPNQSGAATSFPQHILKFLVLFLPCKLATHWKRRDEIIRFLPNTCSSNIKCNISICTQQSYNVFKLFRLNAKPIKDNTYWFESTLLQCNRHLHCSLARDTVIFFPSYYHLNFQLISLYHMEKVSLIPPRHTHYIYHICSASTSVLNFKVQYKSHVT